MNSMPTTKVSDNTRELVRSIIDWASQLLNVHGAEVYLYDARREALELAYARGYAEDLNLIGSEVRPGEGLAGRVFLSGDPMLVEDFANWEGGIPGFNFSPPFFAELAVPMRWRDRTVGALTLTSDTRRRPLTEQDIVPATLVANLAAAAIENAQLYEQLQASLTKLRRTLEQEIAERTAELARSANALEVGAGKEGEGGAPGIDELLGRVMELKIAKKVLGEVTNLPTDASALEDLTPREIEVLTLLAKGRSNHEIAHELSLALSTVKFHVGNILGKLHQTDRTQAALWAVRQGLVTPRQPESFSGLG